MSRNRSLAAHRGRLLFGSAAPIARAGAARTSRSDDSLSPNGAIGLNSKRGACAAEITILGWLAGCLRPRHAATLTGE